MLSRISRFKPGVQRKTHLLLAAILWTTIGLFLMVRGGHWLYESELLYLLLPAMLLGFAKSYCILDKTARKSIDRILLLKDGTCLGAIYSIKTWLLVVAMIGMGIVLRQSPIPRSVLGVLYCTVGWALFWSSRNGWQAWCRRYC